MLLYTIHLNICYFPIQFNKTMITKEVFNEKLKNSFCFYFMVIQYNTKLTNYLNIYKDKNVKFIIFL